VSDVRTHRTSREANEAQLRAHLAAENRRDLDATLLTLHTRCTFVDDQLGRRWHGRAGARDHYLMWWSAFAPTVEGRGVHWVRDDLLVGERFVYDLNGLARQLGAPAFEPARP
jgi:hypothetical protein